MTRVRALKTGQRSIFHLLEPLLLFCSPAVCFKWNTISHQPFRSIHPQSKSSIKLLYLVQPLDFHALYFSSLNLMKALPWQTIAQQINSSDLIRTPWSETNKLIHHGDRVCVRVCGKTDGAQTYRQKLRKETKHGWKNTHIRFSSLPWMVCGLPSVWFVANLPFHLGLVCDYTMCSPLPHKQAKTLRVGRDGENPWRSTSFFKRIVIAAAYR